MPFCRKCGAEVNEKFDFCPKCGTPTKVRPKMRRKPEDWWD